MGGCFPGPRFDRWPSIVGGPETGRLGDVHVLARLAGVRHQSQGVADTPASLVHVSDQLGREERDFVVARELGHPHLHDDAVLDDKATSPMPCGAASGAVDGYTLRRFYGKDERAVIGKPPSRKAMKGLLRRIHDSTTPRWHADGPSSDASSSRQPPRAE